MSQQQTLERLLAASHRKAATKISGIYGALNNDLELVQSRQRRTQAYSHIIDDYCREKYESRNAVHQRSDVVKVNVGGKITIIKRNALASIGSDLSLLSILLSGRWNHAVPKDRNGLIFLDVDSTMMKLVFDTLRSRLCFGSDVVTVPSISAYNIGYDALLLYYNMDTSFILSGENLLSEPSRIVCMSDARCTSHLLSFLSHVFPPEITVTGQLQLNLLYRGSQDGFTASAFHARCDGKCNTVSVIEDKSGNVFGGFADLAWQSQSQLYVPSQKSFIFSLKSSASAVVGPLKYSMNYSRHDSLYHSISHLCCFGGGDLHINNNCNVYGSISQIGTTYGASGDAYRLYSSAYKQTFVTQEIEVYSLGIKLERVIPRVKIKVAQNSTEMQVDAMTEPLNSWMIDALNSGGSVCNSLESKLLYRGTRDGFDAADFHIRCDDKPNTLSIIKDIEGYFIGVFADLPWTSPLKQESVESAGSFAFDLGRSGTSKRLKIKLDTLTHSSKLLCAFEGLTLASDGALDNKLMEIRIKRAVEIEVYEINPITIISPESVTQAINETKTFTREHIAETADIAVRLTDFARAVQLAEEQLLIELLWIEHLSTPVMERKVGSGLLADWRSIYSSSADVLPLSNGLNIVNSGSETLSRVEEAMARLHITKAPVETDGLFASDGAATEGSCSAASVAATAEMRLQGAEDDVISFNVGGTIISVLRSTILRQAPDSVLASNFSGRWSQQAEELDEDGNILLVCDKSLRHPKAGTKFIDINLYNIIAISGYCFFLSPSRISFPLPFTILFEIISHFLTSFLYCIFLSHCITQLEEDPNCFQRIISYLQLKSLLGDTAPEEVRT